MWPIRATDSSFSLTEERRIFSLRSSILDEARCFKASKEGRRKPEDFLVISSIWRLRASRHADVQGHRCRRKRKLRGALSASRQLLEAQ